jgi:hypothetical protein
MASRNNFRTYADGSPKAPRLGTMCEDGNHRLCGGWWCVCPCHDDWDIGTSGHIATHVDHDWEEVDRCVYCSCGPRLYQGTAPTSRDEKEAMAACFDAIHRKTAEEWTHMRNEVLASRSKGEPS